MFLLLKDIYNKAENIKGPKLIAVLAAIFVVFLLIGLLIGNYRDSVLNKDEVLDSKEFDPKGIVEKSGKVIYINPNTHPRDNIKYVLEVPGQKDLLLFSKDQKLVIAEGLSVKVRGAIRKSADGTMDVMDVKEVVINSMEKK